MATVNELRSEIYEALGGRDDSVAQVAALRGLNAGVYAAYRTLEPPECRITGDIVAGAAAGYFDWESELTRCDGRIEGVINTSDDDAKVWFIEFHLWNVLWKPVGESILYYTLYGENFYYKPIPTSSETLRLFYIQYPARLTLGADTIPYPKHEEYILSVATTLSFLVLEEVESGGAWNQLAEQYNMPATLISQMQRLMRGEVDIEHLQRIVSKGSVSP
jgi:hypothetical protein